MRIAAIADIHGNHLALEAVLADIARVGVDLTVNLGDHLSSPLEAGKTADLLLANEMISIRGNHDRWILEKTPEEMGASDRWALGQLTEAHKAWLAALPATRTVEDRIFLCHGTPSDDNTYWLERVLDGGMTMNRIEAIEAEAGGIDCPLLLCAHSHIPRSVRLSDGRLVVNPGSVGCPGYQDPTPPHPHVMQAGTPDATYAILEEVGGRWSVTFRQVPYDNIAMSRLAAERGNKAWASALESGWVR
ncbi:metallophosphoesterase family protein [Thalassobaculum sp.]|uniref:metallophosphoesterase family protein n=1 Tax=Thalassobaculum sp. TaxID=2022740 RepID=UPI003B5C28B0